MGCKALALRVHTGCKACGLCSPNGSHGAVKPFRVVGCVAQTVHMRCEALEGDGLYSPKG